MEEWIKFILALVLTSGFATGVVHLYTAKNTNKSLAAQSHKTNADASAVFSESMLNMLKNSEESAREARKEADLARTKAAEAYKLVTAAWEELERLRVWVIKQGLELPDSPEFDRNGHFIRDEDLDEH